MPDNKPMVIPAEMQIVVDGSYALCKVVTLDGKPIDRVVASCPAAALADPAVSDALRALGSAILHWVITDTVGDVKVTMQTVEDPNAASN